MSQNPKWEKSICIADGFQSKIHLANGFLAKWIFFKMDFDFRGEFKLAVLYNFLLYLLKFWLPKNVNESKSIFFKNGFPNCNFLFFKRKLIRKI
jgi:hypothetical protein